MSFTESVFRRFISTLYLIILYIDARNGFSPKDRDDSWINPNISLLDNLLKDTEMRRIIKALETTLEDIKK